jgi:ferric-dicitrate binding protein FerR (iron transport regulator)
LAAVDRALAATSPNAVVPGAIRGTVEIRRGNSWLPISKTDVYKPGDEIRTGRTGTVELYFSDGARLDLGPNSNLTFTAEEEVSVLKGLLHLEHICVAGCAERRRYRTPTIALAVRGTGFTIDQSSERTVVSVYEGTVDITPTPAAGKSPPAVSVGTGQRLTISTKGVAGSIETFDPAKSSHWWEDQP